MHSLILRARPLVAVLLIVACWGMARLPSPGASERAAAARRFSFAPSALRGVEAGTPAAIRRVHPSLRTIAAWISAVGAAVALNDLDGDGLPNDACLVDPRFDAVSIVPVDRAYRYAPFALIPGGRGYDPATMAPMGCLPGDFDEDGRMDLLVTFWGRTPLLFLKRDGNADTNGYRVQEVTPPARWFTNAATRADVDGDGHADLIVGNYFADGAAILDERDATPQQMQDSMSRAFNGGLTHVLLWVGVDADGTVRFRSADAAIPAAASSGWTLAIGAADIDGDLRPEIYLANDFGPDRLLHNRSTAGAPRFELVTGGRTWRTPRSKTLGRDSFKGMGIDFADLNGDTVPDMYVSNIATEYALEEAHLVFLSAGPPAALRDGRPPYEEAGERLGLSRGGWGWDAKLDDFDNDGVLEALQATGFIKGPAGAGSRWPELQELATANDQLLRRPAAWPWFRAGTELSGHQPNAFYVRHADGRYYDLSREIGIAQPHVSRGIAVADVDADGRLDFAVANQWETSVLYRNQSPHGGAFLGLRLVRPLRTRERSGTMPGGPATAIGTLAVGAVAQVWRQSGEYVGAREVDGGNGHSGKRSGELHFGLADTPSGETVRVDLRWRRADGSPAARTAWLRAGWHTVLLDE